ncbi:hypothetical protein L6452_01958 [Arctium lappa]|uniref:Uncharacterized protein n=1 Tax=Arctium lappa TaxID=4217 RepID=A0ACB9FHJ9_ARCLA|nr:hypothetical protein L6452_01958 [Arctium lappa]
MRETLLMDKLAKLYIDEVVSRHGVPFSIMSDRDSRFTLNFWDGFQKGLGTRVKLSTTYHPQTDGQSERTIQTLEDMLRSCVIDFRGSWDSHLPLFAGPEIVQETADKVKCIRERIKAAQDRQKSYADKKRRPMEFQVGDRVMLKVSPWKGIIRFKKRGKLSPRFLGPFKVLKRVGLQAYQLELPPKLSRIHNTFHVCYLRKCLAVEDNVIPLSELRVDEGNRCVEEPDAILERKSKKLRHKEVTLVKVQWKHHRGANVTWESEEDMKRRYPHIFNLVVKVLNRSILRSEYFSFWIWALYLRLFLANKTTGCTEDRTNALDRNPFRLVAFVRKKESEVSLSGGMRWVLRDELGLGAFEMTKVLIVLFDTKVQKMRSDNGTEFRNAKINSYLSEEGITPNFSTARTPQQNGVVERKNRTLVEAARTMLAGSDLPTNFWTEASLGKFDKKVDEGKFIGYSLASKAFRVFNQRTRTIQESINVSFDDDKSLANKDINPTAKNISESSRIRESELNKIFEDFLDDENSEFLFRDIHRATSEEPQTLGTNLSGPSEVTTSASLNAGPRNESTSDPLESTS